LSSSTPSNDERMQKVHYTFFYQSIVGNYATKPIVHEEIK